MKIIDYFRNRFGLTIKVNNSTTRESATFMIDNLSACIKSIDSNNQSLDYSIGKLRGNNLLLVSRIPARKCLLAIAATILLAGTLVSSANASNKRNCQERINNREKCTLMIMSMAPCLLDMKGVQQLQQLKDEFTFMDLFTTAFLTAITNEGTPTEYVQSLARVNNGKHIKKSLKATVHSLCPSMTNTIELNSTSIMDFYKNISEISKGLQLKLTVEVFTDDSLLKKYMQSTMPYRPQKYREITSRSLAEYRQGNCEAMKIHGRMESKWRVACAPYK